MLVSVTWIFIVFLLGYIFEENFYFTEFERQYGEATFFKDGITIAKFKEHYETVYEKKVEYGENFEIEIVQKVIGIQKLNGNFHLLMNGKIKEILSSNGTYSYNLHPPYSLILTLYQEHFEVSIQEKSYIAEIEGWYPFPTKQGTLIYSWNLVYGKDHSFIVKCTQKKDEYVITCISKKGEQIVWTLDLDSGKLWLSPNTPKALIAEDGDFIIDILTSEIDVWDLYDPLISPLFFAILMGISIGVFLPIFLAGISVYYEQKEV